MKSGVLIAVCLLVSYIPTYATAWHRGIAFGGGEWSSPLSQLGSADAQESLTSLAATGATHVRLVCSWFQTTMKSTRIGPITPPSALASATFDDIGKTIVRAHKLGLNVTLSPIIDPSWDNTANHRASTGPSKAVSSRTNIGRGFDEAQWAAWFGNVSAMSMQYARTAATFGVEMLELASGLDFAFTARPKDWTALVSKVRSVFNGLVTVSTTPQTAAKLSWWGALDLIGLRLYPSLGSVLPLGTAPGVAVLKTAYLPVVEEIKGLSEAHGNKGIVITDIGFQSRPSCHVHPVATLDRDDNDDSAWIQDHDPECQAHAYEATLQVLTGQPWFRGIYWWLWRTDPTQ